MTPPNSERPERMSQRDWEKLVPVERLQYAASRLVDAVTHRANNRPLLTANEADALRLLDLSLAELGYERRTSHDWIRTPCD